MGVGGRSGYGREGHSDGGDSSEGVSHSPDSDGLVLVTMRCREERECRDWGRWGAYAVVINDTAVMLPDGGGDRVSGRQRDSGRYCGGHWW